MIKSDFYGFSFEEHDYGFEDRILSEGDAIDYAIDFLIEANDISGELEEAIKDNRDTSKECIEVEIGNFFYLEPTEIIDLDNFFENISNNLGYFYDESVHVAISLISDKAKLKEEEICKDILMLLLNKYNISLDCQVLRDCKTVEITYDQLISRIKESETNYGTSSQS